MRIDTDFDVRTDAGGKDPDTASSTLRRYHLLLWSRDLPSGTRFELSDTVPGIYLHHRSGLGEFWLSSDGVIPTFTRYAAMAHIVEKVPDEQNEQFLHIAYTIGGFLLWPGNRIDGNLTINQARGWLRRISDRMDLTLECIRRYYVGLDSPLGATLARYWDFFALFGDFGDYVDFWLLQDLINADGGVEFFLPFDDFRAPHIPQSLDTYLIYRRRTIDFVQARNQRIDTLASTLIRDNLDVDARLRAAGRSRDEDYNSLPC